MRDLDFDSQLKGTSEISEARWQRAREEIIHKDLVLDLTGSVMKGQAISCPFHGRDSKPSFWIYSPARGNNSYCFGCPPSDQRRDNIKFVCDLLSLTPTQALLWLEKHYHLPDIAEEVEDEDEEPEEPEGPEWLISVEDLKDPFISRVGRILTSNPDVQAAKAYALLYWKSARSGDPTGMAKVVGREQVERLIRRRSRGRK